MKELDKLDDKLAKLWPEPGNGHGRGHRDGNNYDNDDIDELTRQLSLKYGEQWFSYASKVVGPDRLASWWYQQMKEQWMFHKSSWYKRGLDADDGQGCNGNGCISECEFYAAEGKLYPPNTNKS
jgi:hypothetical protein